MAIVGTLAAPKPVGTKPPSTAPEQSPLVRLLRVEGDARAAKSIDELVALMANETQLLLRARQTFVCRPQISGPFQITAGAGLGKIERAAPLIQSVDGELARLAADLDLAAVRVVSLWPENAGTEPTSAPQRYPFRAGLWMPISGQSRKPIAAILLLRDDGWQQADIILAQRLALVFAQAWHWLESKRQSQPIRVDRRKLAIGTVAATLITLFPVSLATLAPFEITARDPFVVTASMDGVIESIPIAASVRVQKGDVLVRFVSTTLRNRLEVAERELEVADTRVKKTTIAAVNDVKARHDLAVAQSELAVKIAERDYARELLDRTVVTADRAGIAVLGDKRELIGKPATTGERIMEIADPDNVDIRINVPVSDSIMLDTAKPAKIFLDSAPLSPRSANIHTSDYLARPQEGGGAAFRVIARLNDEGTVPRLGLRGTAQLYGDRVPLIYYLLRRPLTAARQWAGL